MYIHIQCFRFLGRVSEPKGTAKAEMEPAGAYHLYTPAVCELFIFIGFPPFALARLRRAFLRHAAQQGEKHSSGIVEYERAAEEEDNDGGGSGIYGFLSRLLRPLLPEIPLSARERNPVPA